MFVLPCLIYGVAFAAFANAQLLGTAAKYGVFAASTITNTGNTVVNGNIGLSPGSSITGFNPPGTYTGSQDISNGAATTAKNDIQAAYNSLAGMMAGTDLTGQDLGGMTLQSGVYKFSSSGQLTGALTLDAGGNANALFVFQFGSTLTTASAASVNLIGGAQACNVYWQVGSSATLGTYTNFVGNILAYASITATTGVVNNGGLYALTAAVTLDTNTISAQGSCNGVVVSSSTGSSSMTTASSTVLSSTLMTTATGTSSPATTSTVPSPTLTTTTTPATGTDMTVTSTTTITVTVPASTTTVTKTGGGTCTVTKTVSTKTSTCTSTTYSTSTQVKTTTCPTPKCTSTKASTTSSKKAKRDKSKKTITKTLTSYCAEKTSTKVQTSASVTHTVSATHTATSTKWHTSTSTKTSTSTHTPSCTSSAKLRRDHQRMFV